MPYDQLPPDTEFAPYYARYVGLVPEGDIVAILATQLEDTMSLVRNLSDEQALSAYAPGKWSIKEVIGHVSDAERIFACRALRFGRGDTTPLATFDENGYATAGDFNRRPLPSLLAELAAVRGASVALFAGLPAEGWTRSGNASGMDVSVRALAWIIAGHELHHRALLSSRYLTPRPAGAAAETAPRSADATAAQ